jgi:hypothetical protein
VESPIPGAPGYAGAALNANNAYNNTLARINAKRQQTLKQYGYTGNVNPTSGQIENVHVDPYNQYGGLQQMLRSGALAGQNADFSAEERGLHGGLAHKADAQLKYDFGQQSAQLGQDFAGGLTDLTDQQTQAAQARDQALYEAQRQAAADAIEAQNFNPGAMPEETTVPEEATPPLPAATVAAIKKSGAKVNDSILKQQVKLAAQRAAKYNKKKKGAK